MNLKQPLVSIIIPNYNHNSYLEQRLESVFNQTFQNFEVILLDDCSTDNSRDILTEYAKNSKVSHCIFNKINSGNTFIQWNKGISLAKGEYVWIAESDDFCELNFLEVVLEPMIKNKEVVLSYCQSNRTNEKGEVTGTWLNHTDELDSQLFLTNFILEGNEFNEKFLIYKNLIPNASAVIFNKNKAIEIGFLDTHVSLKFVSDWLFYFHMILNGKIFYTYHSLNYFRYHSQSVIATSIRSRNENDTRSILLKTRKKIKKILNEVHPINEKKIHKLNDIEVQSLIFNKLVSSIKKYKIGSVVFKVINKIRFLFLRKRLNKDMNFK